MWRINKLKINYKEMGTLSYKDFKLNKVFDFGYMNLSEQEIIDFALFIDPLDFHTNKEIAEKGIFGGLITSGPHLFFLFYKNHYVPLFKDTIIAGLEVNNWKFLKPVYANMKVFCKVTIASMKPNKEKNRVAVKWHFDFTNEKGEHFQMLDMTVLHKMKEEKKKIKK
ncbi:MAG: hypothetical protein A3F72_17145 [Bacteroidetes bacterium RIFCSPLOWO2_12_FULL_35_15]|nr:MAG: hypothetical protein A3F72_17145 [Bacteroidetes bacterium RIFCSPLOWO2_12_FULL_35_15]